jgi:predicted DNA binding CopG/RHH family protein
MKKQMISVEMPEELIQLLKQTAAEQELSVSGLIRLIIKKYFKI